MEIALTQGQVALIDDDDFELVSRYKWCAAWDPSTKSFRAITTIRKDDGKRTALLMHRLIMNANKGEEVDHIHHFTLDNRKSELRLCTRSQNMQNTHKYANNRSGHKGVYWINNCQKWRAQIRSNGQPIHLGIFTDINDAIAARAAATLLYHGEFGRISCP